MSRFLTGLRGARKRVLIAAGATAALLLAGCGGAAGNDASAPDAVDGLPGSGTVHFFGASTENPYFQLNADGAEEAAAEFGWDFTHTQSNTQEEQDAAVQQMLTQGEKPIGVLLYPIAGEAAIATEQAIMSAGIPLILMGQVPREGQEDLYTAYAGVEDVLSGETAAELLVAGAERADIELGDGIIVNTLAGHTATQDRAEGFTEVLSQLAPDSEILDNVPSGGFLEAEGYDIGSQLIPANRDKINWVYGVNDALAVGAMRAAEENGLTPGEDIFFVGGTCMNATTNQAVMDGLLVGTAVQSPWIEGATALYTLAAYLNTGETVDGELRLPDDAPPSVDDAPHKFNFMPNPMVENSQESFESVTIWGKPASVLCDPTIGS